jgi:GTP pyrophosphokinase
VITASARSKIKNSLKEVQKEIANEGKEILSRKLRHIKIPFNENTVNELVNYFKLKTSLDLFMRFGNGTINNKQLRDFASNRSNSFYKFFKSKIRKKTVNNAIDKDEITYKYDLLVFGKEEDKLDYKNAKCCSPIPGDKVFGFITINEGIKIHKYDCPNAVALQANYAYRILSAKWIDSSQQEHKVLLRIKGIDNKGLVTELTRLISNQLDVNIYNINISGDDGYFDGKLTVGINNKKQLKNILIEIKKMEGITKVERVHK